jgi:hypothetical protein
VTDRLLTGAAILIITLLSFFWFPGHTYLQSDTQIYVPILEHLWDPSVLADDAIASRPHVTYTIYDEIAIGLRKLTGLGFQPILLGQHLLYRGVGVAGLYLIGVACGLPGAAAILLAAVASLGAYVVGPTVLTVEYEPVPRAFALPFILLSIGLVGKNRWTWATISACIGFLFHPPTAIGYCILLAAAEIFLHHRRSLWVFAGVAVGFIALISLETKPLESQHIFSRIDATLEPILRMRGNYNWIEVWIGRYLAQYLFLWAFGAAALWRVWRHLSPPFRFFCACLPLSGLAALPVSYLLLEQAKLMLIPEIQPARYLLFTTLFAAMLGALAAAHEALERRPVRAVLWLLVPFAIPLSPALFDISLKRAGVMLLLALTGAAALEATQRLKALSIPTATAAAVLTFALIPTYGEVLNYPVLDDEGLRDVEAWAQLVTPPDAVFQFADAGRALEPGIFRARAMRPIYADWKGGGQVNYLPSFAHLWARRWAAVKKVQPLEQYAALGIDYVVFTRAKAPQGVPPAYEDERYVVIRVRQRPCGKPCAGGVEPDS